MYKLLVMGTLFCVPIGLLCAGCSEVQTAAASLPLPTQPVARGAEMLQIPGGPVVIRDIRLVRSIDGSEARLSCVADWVEQENGSRRIAVDGRARRGGEKQIALYDMEGNLVWRMGWDRIGADFSNFQETDSERLESLMAPGPGDHWQETYALRSGEERTEFDLVYRAASEQDRAEARREYIGSMPEASSLYHNHEAERLIFLLQAPEFVEAVRRASGETAEGLRLGNDGGGVGPSACEVRRQCTSIACTDGGPTTGCLVCLTGSEICSLFGT